MRLLNNQDLMPKTGSGIALAFTSEPPVNQADAPAHLGKLLADAQAVGSYESEASILNDGVFSRSAATLTLKLGGVKSVPVTINSTEYHLYADAIALSLGIPGSTPVDWYHVEQYNIQSNITSGRNLNATSLRFAGLRPINCLYHKTTANIDYPLNIMYRGADGKLKPLTEVSLTRTEYEGLESIYTFPEVTASELVVYDATTHSAYSVKLCAGHTTKPEATYSVTPKWVALVDVLSNQASYKIFTVGDELPLDPITDQFAETTVQLLWKSGVVL